MFTIRAHIGRSAGRSTPQLIEHRCLEYQYTKLGRQTLFGRWVPPVIKQRCLEYWYTKLGRWTPLVIEQRSLEYQYTQLGRWTPHESRIDALNTATPNLADKSTLADGPPTQNCQWWTINWCMTYWKSMCSIRAHLKLLKFTPQVYSSSVPVRLRIGTSMCLVRVHVKVLKFTGQGYSSSLLVSYTPHLKLSLRADQVLADLCVQ